MTNRMTADRQKDGQIGGQTCRLRDTYGQTDQHSSRMSRRQVLDRHTNRHTDKPHRHKIQTDRHTKQTAIQADRQNRQTDIQNRQTDIQNKQTDIQNRQTDIQNRQTDYMYLECQLHQSRYS